MPRHDRATRQRTPSERHRDRRKLQRLQAQQAAQQGVYLRRTAEAETRRLRAEAIELGLPVPATRPLAERIRKIRGRSRT